MGRSGGAAKKLAGNSVSRSASVSRAASISQQINDLFYPGQIEDTALRFYRNEISFLNNDPESQVNRLFG
jgi:hypothetical protein